MKKRVDFSFRPRTYWSSRRRGSGDAEIARVSVCSPSCDVITLRARSRTDGRIHYRMIHEDANGRTRHQIQVRPASSVGPLTFRELIEALESACYLGPCPDEGDDQRYGGVIWGTLRLSLEHGLDHADDYLFMLKITSELYPQLERYYQDRIAEWCLSNCVEDEDCGKNVRLRTGSFPRKLIPPP